jgi:hypothetical protein
MTGKNRLSGFKIFEEGFVKLLIIPQRIEIFTH